MGVVTNGHTKWCRLVFDGAQHGGADYLGSGSTTRSSDLDVKPGPLVPESLVGGVVFGHW